MLKYRELIDDDDLVVYEFNEDILDLIKEEGNDVLHGAKIGSVYYRLHEDDEGNEVSHYYKIRYIMYSMRGRKCFAFVIHIEVDHNTGEVEMYQENYDLRKLVCDPLTIQVSNIPDTIKERLLKKINEEL